MQPVTKIGHRLRIAQFWSLLLSFCCFGATDGRPVARRTGVVQSTEAVKFLTLGHIGTSAQQALGSGPSSPVIATQLGSSLMKTKNLAVPKFAPAAQHPHGLGEGRSVLEKLTAC